MESFSIFDERNTWLSEEIYIHRVSSEIKHIIKLLGGPIKSSKLIGVKYSALKEWVSGRKPISLSRLLKLLNHLGKANKKIIKKNIEAEPIFLSCRYSDKIIKFPKNLSSNLAYAVGLILGDGSLAEITQI